MFTTLFALLLCVGSGAIGSVFFAFSTFVMRALSTIAAEAGISAMQRINVVVLNRVFLGVFVGTATIAAATIVVALASWSPPRSLLLLTASALYLVGTFGVTMRFNVPRNNRLAHLASGSPEAHTYWPVYVREWSLWNHVRTVASLASCACSALAMAVQPHGTQ